MEVRESLPALSMAPPSQARAYLIVAGELFQGIKALSVLQNIHPRGCAMLAAHALECTLKAFLWHEGKRKEIRKNDIQHDIIELWSMAYKERSLGIPMEPPDWVKILHEGHKNFYFRYQEGKGKGNIVQSGQTPSLIPMVTELRKLINMVRHTIKGE